MRTPKVSPFSLKVLLEGTNNNHLNFYCTNKQIHVAAKFVRENSALEMLLEMRANQQA